MPTQLMPAPIRRANVTHLANHLSATVDRRFRASRVLSILLTASPENRPLTDTQRAEIRRALADLDSAVTIEANATRRRRMVS